MFVKGTVVTVELDVEIKKNGGGVYQGGRLSYRDESDQLKEQNFHNNAFKFNAALKTAMENFKAGDKIYMEKIKEGEFWNVKAMGLDDGSAQTPTAPAGSPPAATTPYAGKPATSPKGNFPTAEERAQTQVYIVRQSTLAHAINALPLWVNAGKGIKVTPELIIETAKKFENHVMGINYDQETTGTATGADTIE